VKDTVSVAELIGILPKKGLARRYAQSILLILHAARLEKHHFDTQPERIVWTWLDMGRRSTGNCCIAIKETDSVRYGNLL
jgi:hypothetical protein